MNIPTIQPPRLIPGDTLAIVAPAGPIKQRDEFERGIKILQGMGFRARYDDRIFESCRYLAGDDASRAEELMKAFEDPGIQGIISLRGGYGCSRLILHLLERRLRHNPKVFMGFSDLTTLHLLFRRRFGWITIHGPMATTIGSMAADQESHLFSLWTNPDYRPTISFDQLETWAPGTAEGTLIGGCLSLVAASIGTPYEIQTDGKILFLEDQGEPPFRLDRMLTHLHLAGKLRSVAGLLLGSFSDCEPDQGGYTAQETLKDILHGLDVPILANFPGGHGMNNWAIPLGARVRIDANARFIEFLDPAVC
jgi:muramoyltetrapeptide carboxypeptidase